MSGEIFLVRHAKAGERRGWDGADELRPLSTAGWKQARKLAKRLGRIPPESLISSPYVRCIETLQPLGDRTRLEIVIDDRLTEGAAFEDALELLGEVPDRAVLCTHGDIIPAVLDALVRRGLEVRSAPDWRKGSVWVLRRKSSGRFTHATVWPPPSL